MTGWEMEQALKHALGEFLAKLSQDAAKAAYEASETSRAVGIASQQLRRIADLLERPRPTPSRFATIGAVQQGHGDESILTLESGRPDGGYRFDVVRVLSPRLVPRHGSAYLEVKEYNRVDGYVVVVGALSAATRGDWLEWHPIKEIP